MRKFKLFLKWMFQYRGTTKVHPLEYIPVEGKVIGEAYLESKGAVKEKKCPVCKDVYYQLGKSKSPMCPRLQCFMAFYTVENETEKQRVKRLQNIPPRRKVNAQST